MEKKMRKFLRINPEKTVDFMCAFLKKEFRKTGIKNAVLGVSGGIDSAVAACLCERALGKEHTFGIILPYKSTSGESLDCASELGKNLDIKCLQFDITPQIEAYYSDFSHASTLRKGNKMARERMSILYDLAAYFKALVVGTSNKSEIYLGYGTLHGDVACDINPVNDLYKTQIYQVAEYLGVPAEIIKRKPSAELWKGQTDEQELGFTYAAADEILYYYIDKKIKPEDIIKSKGIDEKTVRKVIDKVKKSEFKRTPPITLKIPDEIKYAF
jgi:NAD+ synthase